MIQKKVVTLTVGKFIIQIIQIIKKHKLENPFLLAFFFSHPHHAEVPRARDQTHTRAVTRATVVTMLGP